MWTFESHTSKSVSWMNIRIYHECEGGKEKLSRGSRLASLGLPSQMTNSDRKGQIFLSHPHTNNGLFFLRTTKYLNLYWKKHEKDFQNIMNMLRWDMVT